MKGETLRIIFVEDLESDYLLALRVLKEGGFQTEVTRVEREQDLRNMLRSFQPDIVISDYALPEFDGMSALEITREMNPEIPFIVLTGSMNEETAVDCLKAGASDYVIKEHLTRLPYAVRESLKHARLQREDIQTREALKESEALHRKYIDNAPHGIFVADKDGRYIEVNRAACEITGYKREELLQMSIGDLIPDETEKETLEHFKTVKRLGNSTGIVPFRHKDGNVRFWSVDAAAISAEQFIAFTVDVTQQEELKEKLKVSRTRLERTQKIAEVGSWEFDLNTGRVWASERTRSIYGMGDGEWLKEEVEKIPLPQFRGILDSAMENLLERNEPYDLEFTIRRPSDGMLVDVRSVAEFSREKNLVVGALQNISKLKRMEQDVKNIFMLSPDMVCIASIDTNTFLRVNPAFTEVLGYSEEELLSRPFTDFVHPEDVDRTERLVSDQLRKGIVVPRFENRYRCKDGTYRDLMWSSHPIPERNLTYAVAHDITEMKQQIVERLQFQSKMLHAQKLESLGVMAGGIAHDFNNLLMAIIGNLDMAQSKLKPDSETMNSIEQATRAARRAVDLTRQVLAYSGRDQKFTKRVNLSELVTENVHMLQVVIPRTVSLKMELAEDLPSILADSGQLQQIVMNLITNAAESIEKNTGVVAISIRVEQLDSDRLQTSLTTEHPEPGEFVMLEVVDTGLGMDQNTIQRIFDPFFSSKVHGRGLGMSAVLGIVKSHGGAIFLKSQLGIGTTIQVAFPVLLEEDSGVEEAGAASENVSETLRAKKNTHRKILVADDEDAVRDVTSVMIEKLGYKILEAKNGREAVEVFRENRDDIACVILDLSMPVMDGITAIGRLREIDKLVPVVITSGYNRNARVEEILGNPTVRFLQKPYSLTDVKRTIGELLEI